MSGIKDCTYRPTILRNGNVSTQLLTDDKHALMFGHITGNPLNDISKGNTPFSGVASVGDRDFGRNGSGTISGRSRRENLAPDCDGDDGDDGDDCGCCTAMKLTVPYNFRRHSCSFPEHTCSMAWRTSLSLSAPQVTRELTMEPATAAPPKAIAKVAPAAVMGAEIAETDSAGTARRTRES
ncbi:hypothetical protein QR680_008200 [Steinernema hermaphroditum]|uniref:Uncharacterized protein n=1 Tax=Steinernema hermaphroditum TaxID=289476 RepID=A0AA39M7N1_9BILA|nr:hypothetical protein QR680_008200 [Steinernema hermaphroditum]